MTHKKVLVIATHPDDETLGCGGTLLKLGKQKADLHWLIVTNMTSDQYDKKTIEIRQKEIDQVSQFYGFKEIFKCDFPTTQLDQIPLSDLIGKIGKVVQKIKPDTIFLPNRSDIHSDHKITFQAVMSVTKSFHTPFLKNVYMYETLSETELAPALEGNAFMPNAYFDITEFMDKKIDAMNIYKSEIKAPPFPRSEKNIRALATFRGATVLYDYAESFMKIKEIQ